MLGLTGAAPTKYVIGLLGPGAPLRGGALTATLTSRLNDLGGSTLTACVEFTDGPGLLARNRKAAAIAVYFGSIGAAPADDIRAIDDLLACAAVVVPVV